MTKVFELYLFRILDFDTPLHVVCSSLVLLLIVVLPSNPFD